MNLVFNQLFSGVQILIIISNVCMSTTDFSLKSNFELPVIILNFFFKPGTNSLELCIFFLIELYAFIILTSTLVLWANFAVLIKIH